MKPKFRSLIAAFAPLSRSSLIICASLCAVNSASADQTWTGAADANWATLTNWSGGALPLATDNAVFDSTSTANLGAIALGANRTINGITFTSPASDVTIVAGSTLNLNSGGINLQGATRNLTINAAVNVATFGQQAWSVASGQTLTLASLARTTSGGVNNLNVGSSLVLPSTGGSMKVGAVAIGVFADQQGNPYATYGIDDWAGTDATGVVIPAVYLDFPAAGAITGAYANWSISGAGAYTMSAQGPASFRLANSTGPVSIANTNTSTLRGVLMASGSQSVSINGGFIRPNRSSSGAGGNSPMNFIQNSVAGDLTISSSISNASSSTTVSVVKSGAGKMIVTGGTGYTGGTFINGGTLQIGDGGAAGSITPSSLMVIQPGASFVMNLSADSVMNGAISGSGSYTQLGSGITTLGGTSAGYTGVININGGGIAATSLDNLGSGSAININGGLLRFLGGFDPTSRTVTIGGSGATFDTNGNNISFAGGFTSGGTGSLTKTGGGSLTLSTDSNYSGGTSVTGGTLVADGLISTTGSGPVMVDSGAGIAGTGKIGGAVTVASSADLSPGSAGIGTLTVGGLNLAAGTTGTFEFNNTPSNDSVAVSSGGSLTLNGGAITIMDVTGIPIAFTTPGTYNLISHTSPTLGTGASSLSIANPQPGYSYTFADTGTMVTLKIATAGVVGSWLPDGGGSWLAAANWSSNPTLPNGTGRTSIFNKTLTAAATITLDGAVTAGAITLSSSPFGYTIAAGSGGTLTLNNGASDATIANNVGSHTISANIALASNTLLSSGSAAESLTLSGVISGTGKLTKPGPGSLFLNNNNTFNGLLKLTGGTTGFASGGLGLGSLEISGATLVWNVDNTQDISNRIIAFGANPVTFNTNGNNVSLLAGAIGNNGVADFTKAGQGKLTLGKDATFSGNITIADGILQLGTGGSTGSVAGEITNNAELVINLQDGAVFSNLLSGTGSLVHAGSGSLIIPYSNTFSGSTRITSGSLRLEDPLALQNSTLEYLAGGGSISFELSNTTTLGGLDGDKNLTLMNVAEVPEAVALTVGGNNLSTTYDGILSGDGSFSKLGSGILTLGNANTYTGATTVGGGDLQISTGGSITNTALTVNGTGRMVVAGGSLGAATNTFAVSSGGLYLVDGTATFDTTIFANGGSGTTFSPLIKVEGGVLTAPSIVLGRTFVGLVTEPPVDNNLYLTGGEVNVSGDLMIGSGSIQPNSTVVARVDSGILTVAGATTVGINNGGRWAFLAVNGGEFVSTGTAVNSGVLLGGPYASHAGFFISGGISTVERIQFGQGIVDGDGLIRLTGGELYVGAGGITLGSTGVFTTEIRLTNGVLAGKDSWSTDLPVNVDGAATIQSADSNFAAVNITLNGALAGAGSLSKTGDGKLTINGGNSYLGDTVVNQGILSVTTRTFADAAGMYIYPSTGGHLNLDFAGGDQVGALFIDDTPMADGIYGSTTNSTPGIIKNAAITGNGLLYVNTALPTSPYETWASGAGLVPGNDGPGDDPDFDGIANQLEFVLGGNPLTSDTGILPEMTMNALEFIFTFDRQDDSLGSVALIFQHGSDLSGWTDVIIPETSAGVVSVLPGTPADVITVKISRAANTKLFGRLKAIK